MHSQMPSNEANLQKRFVKTDYVISSEHKFMSAWILELQKLARKSRKWLLAPPPCFQGTKGKQKRPRNQHPSVLRFSAKDHRMLEIAVLAIRMSVANHWHQSNAAHG